MIWIANETTRPCHGNSPSGLQNFNSEQLAAIETSSRHTLVLAGAGTGKTRTIIGRATYLIQSGVPADDVLIITFTRRAASEIRSRINLGSHQAEAPFAGTFHSWAMQLIRRNPAVFQLESSTLLDQDDVRTVFRKFRRSIEQSSAPKATLLADFHSLMANTRLDAYEVAKLADVDDELIPIFLAASQFYSQYKRQHNYIDYDDILERLAAGLQDESLAQAVGSRFSHILIDEMQDTNPLQYSIIDALAPHTSLFCVGDDAQSIYGFRGADFHSIHSFTHRYPAAQVFRLQQNYRSTQKILDLSNWLLRQSPLNYDKQLVAARDFDMAPVLFEGEDEYHQADFVAQTILEAYDREERWSENMVLVRTGYSARSIESKFLQYNIPHVLIGGVTLFGAKHVKDVMSLLRILSNRQDEIAWMRYLQLWPRIGGRTADRLFQSLAFDHDTAAETNGTLLDAVAKFTESDQSGWTLPLIHCLRDSHTPAVAFANAVETLTPRLSAIYQNDHWETRQQDFEYVSQLAEQHRTIAGFVDEYLLNPVYESQTRKSEGEDKVKIITVHSAKGLEASRCFVTDVQPGRYPKAGLTEAEIEEERRVLYVALTRAANELYVCRCQRGWGSRYVDSGDEGYFLNGLPAGLLQPLAPPRRVTRSVNERMGQIRF